MFSGHKKCGQCGGSLPASHFHKRSMSLDGLAACCKQCQRIYDRERLHAPHRIEARQKYKSNVTRDRKKIYVQTFVSSHPQKRAAHIAVGNAVRDGRLMKMVCEVCSNPKTQAHHDDYSKPLDVRWLCVRCHADHHLAINDVKLRTRVA